MDELYVPSTAIAIIAILLRLHNIEMFGWDSRDMFGLTNRFWVIFLTILLVFNTAWQFVK